MRINNLKNVIRQILKENSEYQGMGVDPNYTHFIVNKETNKVLTGNEYNDLDRESIMEYAKQDILDFDKNPKDYKIITTKRCKQLGIDPFDFNNWEK